jgi:hypothetical protein
MIRRRLVNPALGVTTNPGEIPAGFLKIGVYHITRDAIHRSDRDDMSDLTISRTRQQMTGSGFAGLLGLFAGLCAIFAGCVTVSDWLSETAQARWPVVSAVVDRADLVASSRAPKDGGTTWRLSYRVKYELDGEPQAASLTSRVAFSDADAASLRAWSAVHKKGSHVDVRVDPIRKNQAVFAAPEASGALERTRTDLILFAISAFACAGLLTLARYLGAREARAAPHADGASSGGLGVGIACAAMGLMLVGLAVHAAIAADPFSVDNLMGVPAGLMFVFAGILMALPPQYGKWQGLLAKLTMTCFALTFDWVAFGPGERHFTGSFMGSGFIPREFVGRAVFGVSAVVLDICAIAMWMGKGRLTFGQPANPADSTAGPAGRLSPSPDRSSAA